MKREELLQAARPILFNTEMIRAILEGRKMVTRRVIKDVTNKVLLGQCVDGGRKDIGKIGFGTHACGGEIKYIKPPYQRGDILYVRETWAERGDGTFMFRANYSENETFFRDGEEIKMRWYPSIHMPKEAARIFLKVTGVRVEQIKDITEGEAHREGFDSREAFISTILKMYPDCTEGSWVWVIEFERLEAN